jgi:hypothetical protein
LPLRCGRAADQADLVRRPGKSAEPVEFIIRVGERGTENVVVAFGVEAAALVHFHVCVAVLDGVQGGGHIVRGAQGDIPVVEVVRGTDKEDGIFFRRVLRSINIGLHAFAVVHRHHDLAFDGRYGFQFSFYFLAVGDENVVFADLGMG